MQSLSTILSTKKLSLSQRELLLNAGVGFVAYDAISISFLPAKIPRNIENAIFTSRNGVKSVKDKEISIVNCFCVGEKTKSLLEKNGYKVVKVAKNASELAHFISKNHKDDTFHYFCGNLRREEFPSVLKNEKISLFEVETYKTTLNGKKFDQKWDGILFFSPSGVQSYISENKIGNSTVFCIGQTTASEAKKYSCNVVVANATSVESVIAKAVKVLTT